MAGTIAIVVAILTRGDRGTGPWPEFVILTALLTTTWSFPLLLPKDSAGVEALQLDESFVVAMALLLTPLGSIAAFAIGVGIGQLVRRRPLVKWMFNWGQMVASVALAQVVMAAIAPGSHSGVAPSRLAAVLVGAVVFLVANQGAVAAIMALAEGASLRRMYSDGVGVRL